MWSSKLTDLLSNWDRSKPEDEIQHQSNLHCIMGFISGHTANEASVLQNLFLLLLFTPQVSKCVDDDTEDQVENDDDDNEEEEHVINHSGTECRLLQPTTQNHNQHMKTP